jgi:2-polyprenyl-3-methyl-5-hydroxy-6-metoxy-1,4-benzoquinol methylase
MVADRSNNTPQEVTADSQVARLFTWRRGFNAMHLIDLGVRLGLFKAFADTPDVTVWQVADRLGLHAPYVEVWCTTAYSFELLDADEERRFRLAPFVNDILANPAHPRYLGEYVRLGTAFATEDYRHAPEAFRTGSTVPFQGRSQDFALTVAEAIAGMNLVVARRILPNLSGVAEQLHQSGAILEVGCGTGNLLLQVAQAFPNSRCTGVDIDPTGVAVAREAVEKAGLTERVQILEGDVSSAVESETYDVVVMVEVLHEISSALRPGVLRGCARALRVGGWLVIVDETYPSTLAEARRPEYLFPVQTGFEELLWGNVVPTKM